jgi:hypothetical protein
MKKTEKKQLYFSPNDETTCHEFDWLLADCIAEAKDNGEDEFKLIEAIPDNSNHDYVWCTHYQEVVERVDCKKHICPHYKSKSGRGVCQLRGNFYLHGKEVIFKVSDYE